ncbi:MAG: VOC family protein [Chloroflexi bacterium]|nr:VOC family protein [Chloroflexota bacterium]MDA1219121.1 VOC family protein [Chloroflexota bacterium]
MEANIISHIAFCVRDIEKSLAFYRDVLGMKVTFDQVQDTTSGFLTNVYRHSRQTRRTVHLSYSENSAAPHLVMTTHPGDDPDGEPIMLDQVGISHFSFTVPDTKALAEELESKGVRLAAPIDSWMNAQGKINSFYVYDPDGILIQFDGGGAA